MLDWLLVGLLVLLFAHNAYLSLKLRMRERALEALQQAVIIMPPARKLNLWPTATALLALLALALALGIRL